MKRKQLRCVSVAFVGAIALGAGASAVPAGAATALTVCYDRATRVMHFSVLGRCYSPRQITLVFGAGRGIRGEHGVSGTRGVQGIAGPQGPQGDAGLPGGIGVAGVQGPQGALGPAGGSGVAGGTGITGGTGPAGGSGPVGGTGTSGGSGTAGGTGPIGGTGAPGVNQFVKVSATDATASDSGTLSVTCSPGSVASGGGYAASAMLITASQPTPSGAGWTVSWVGRTTSTNVVVTAICVIGTSS